MQEKIRIWVSVPEQRLYVLENGKRVADYPVSTAKNGTGELSSSGCTPRGLHQIRLKIGAGAPLGAVFLGRRPTGEIYSPVLADQYPHRDWILTRILWLSGLEPGRNRFGKCDTLRRFIYIHGCPHELPLGVPLSHGCIRMSNEAIEELFERVAKGDRVLIDDTCARPTDRFSH
jgi:lipoprotein-anchoring transpeptidase ErfK/SrfK